MDTMEKRSAKATRQHYKKDRRETVVQVRMNEEELTLLDAKRGSRSRSNFLRGALHDKRNITETTRVEMPQLDSVVMELNRIGVNVNQMARVLNSQLAKRRMNSVSQMMEYRSLKNDIAMLDECKANIEKMPSRPWTICVRKCSRVMRCRWSMICISMIFILRR